MRMRITVRPQATLADRPRQKPEAVSQNLASRCLLTTAGLILSRASMSPAPSGLKRSRRSTVRSQPFDSIIKLHLLQALISVKVVQKATMHSILQEWRHEGPRCDEFARGVGRARHFASGSGRVDAPPRHQRIACAR